MGSNQSKSSIEIPLLFSDFCSFLMCNRGRSLLQKLKIDRNLLRESTSDKMETLVHLWYMNSLSKTKWHHLMQGFRDTVMQDFIDTLYCSSRSFDEIFLLLFTNAKARYFALDVKQHMGLSTKDLRVLVEDILLYSSQKKLVYSYKQNDKQYKDNLIDFPLKTFSLCPCTRRPLYVAMYLGKPDIVRLLLNCGARVPYEDVCVCVDGGRHPLQNVMDVMKPPHCTSKSAMNVMSEHTEKCASALRVLLVDVECTSPLRNRIFEALNQMTGEGTSGILPSLKHLCRFRIRSQMKCNLAFYHPSGLRTLQIPPVLKNYINISE